MGVSTRKLNSRAKIGLDNNTENYERQNRFFLRPCVVLGLQILAGFTGCPVEADNCLEKQ
jgi:hypothetical protein